MIDPSLSFKARSESGSSVSLCDTQTSQDPNKPDGASPAKRTNSWLGSLSSKHPPLALPLPPFLCLGLVLTVALSRAFVAALRFQRLPSRASQEQHPTRARAAVLGRFHLACKLSMESTVHILSKAPIALARGLQGPRRTIQRSSFGGLRPALAKVHLQRGCWG